MVRSKLKQAIVVAVAAVVAACTVHKQSAPDLTGPSELGTSITVSVSPDILTQNGTSQALVTVTARDSNGQPFRNLSLRAEIVLNGVIVDFGSLSARSLVTDANGHATFTYTAPPAPAIAVDSGTVVSIDVTPIGTDFGNSTPRTATIRLVPPNIVVPPDGLVPKFTFTPTAPSDHQAVLFDGTSSTSNALNPIASYAWDFGDGDSASGPVVQHEFDDAGTFVVRLRISDAVGRSASVSQSINVGQGTAPQPAFEVSPSSPIPNLPVFFNASATKPGAGRTIASYQWDFGDGTSGSGMQASHAYASAGGYTVTLVVTDDAGRTGVLSKQLTVTSAAPTADFAFSPTAPSTATTINFNASASKASTGRTIVSYSWSFGDGTTATGISPSKGPSGTVPGYTAPGTYNVILTVIDDQGNAATVSKPVTVS